MLEVEQKYRAAASAELRAALEAAGAEATGSVEQTDHYFGHPCRDFAETDEAVRVRRVGESCWITYKGPKVDTSTKTRREIEVPLEGGPTTIDQACELLAAVGFFPVATVRKTRQTYRLLREGRAVEVAVDDVEGLGAFVEVETRAPDEQLDAARQTIAAVAQQLGLDAPERQSYLELLLAQSGAGP